ncbi:Competence-damage inducible protein [Mycoplasma yeatsii 13926]|uniref:Competence-damage inducible protein n=2 Tax=Mycoplasma yeatsii TaxID=51365 RepID=S6G3U3_9MOLU|nr:Competence-damage inducible protein [Mycoplasma yeatsii 13926]
MQNNLTISVCETFTTGNFMTMLTKGMVDPAKIFRYSCMGFSNKFKINTMDVNKNLIRRHGPHSVECAKAIAYNLKEETKSDISVCFIGNPFPANQENKTVSAHGLIMPQQVSPKTCYAVVVFSDDGWDWFEIKFNNYRGYNIDNIRKDSVEFIAQQILNYL